MPDDDADPTNKEIELTTATDIRCDKCNRLLCRKEGGKVEAKCPRCNHLQVG